MILDFLLSLTVFIVLFLLVIGIQRIFRNYQERHELLEKIGKSGEYPNSPDQKIFSVKNKFFDFLNKLGKQASPEKQSDYQQTRLALVRAGIRQPNALFLFWGSKILLAVCLPIAFSIFRVTFFKVLDPTKSLAICLFLAVVGLYLPNLLWLRLKIARRKKKISEGIPDALDLLVVCVEAGMGLDSAIYRVGEESTLTNKPLADELKFYNLEMRAGKSRKDALRDLALRVELEEVRSLVTLLIQAEKFGTSVAQSLRIYSDAFRTKRFQRAEEIAAKLPVKLIFPLMFFIMPSLFVVLIGPAVMSIYQAFIHH